MTAAAGALHESLHDDIGYRHHLYAASLEHIGTPLPLLRTGAWLLQRRIAGSPFMDAAGPYPLLLCGDWSALPDDLAALHDRVVSVTAVIDPLGDHGGEDGLRAAFPDLLRPFKQHYVTDLRRPLGRHLSAHHARNVRRARQRVQVERCSDPGAHAAAWQRLYGVLVHRHGITGFAAFPADALRAQLHVPGVVVFRAGQGNDTVGMTLWYAHADRVYYHLGAYDEAGYAAAAAYALFAAALEHFADEGLEYAVLGAGAGTEPRAHDGLARFKAGWSTETRAAFLGGRICNRPAYDELVRQHAAAPGTFFPAYRAPT